MLRTLDIARDQRAPVTARRALEDFAPELERDALDDARLLVTELVSNSVRHGRGDVVRVVLEEPLPGTLRCEVIDDGHGFDPPGRRTPAHEPGGWGLVLVEQLADAWGVHRGSTHVWFELAPRR